MAFWILIGFLLVGVAAGQDCSNKALNASSGNITSPSFPSNYVQNLSCSWRIEAPKGKHIKFQFLSMNIEDCGYDCNCDGIDLSIGKTSADRKSRICQKSIKGPDENKDWSKPIYSVFNNIWLTFYSDNTPSNGYKGFDATYQIIDNAPPVCPSDPVLHTGNEGSISTPNYPKNYPNERKCWWMIMVSDGPHVKLTFTDFTLEGTGCQLHGKCSCDYVKVYDGETNATLAELCGSDLPKPVVSNSKKILVEFLSTFSTNFKGFEAKYMSTSENATGGSAVMTTAEPNSVSTSSNVSQTTTEPNSVSTSSNVTQTTTEPNSVSTSSNVSQTTTDPNATASGIASFGLITAIMALVTLFIMQGM